MKNKEIKITSFVSTGKLNTEVEDIKKFILSSYENRKMTKKLSDILLTDMDIIKEYLKGQEMEEYKMMKEELEKVSGKKNWVEGTFSGYSQSDWQKIWFVKDEVSQDELKYMEAFYMGKISEFRDEDDCCYYVPDDVVWKGKKAICDYLGFKVDETEIYDDQDKLIE